MAHCERPPWMDEEYVLARAKRRRFERIYKRTRCFIDKRCLDIQTKICKDLVFTKKSQQLNQTIVAHCNSQKSMFALINNMSGLSKSKALPDIYSDNLTLSNRF